MIVNNHKPNRSGVYLVDRTSEKLGTPFRFYNAETDTWGLCSYDYDTALQNKTNTTLGVLPWVGPAKPSKPPVEQPEAVTTKTKLARLARSPKTVEPTKNLLVDGSVFFREDRKKWVVVIDGKQPCARDTKDDVLKWLSKKFPSVRPIL
jgi:hypothetical protein